MPRDTLLLYDQFCLEHDTGAGHPECPARVEGAISALQDDPVARTRWLTPRDATTDQILRVHDPNYVGHLERMRGQAGLLDADTSLSKHSVDVAYLTAGAAIAAVHAVCNGLADRSFSVMRPPGHHAESDRAMGFCIFNNAAVAAAYALAETDCERVLIVDWDVHHGNGTQHIFEHRNDVLYFSIHQYPFFPGTGARDEVGHGEGAGYTVNVPVPTGLGDGDYLRIFEQVLIPIARQYDPDLVLISAGYDAHARDPLGGMRLTAHGFAQLTANLCALADECANGRVVAVLEGGYDTEGVANSVRATLEVLAGHSAPDIDTFNPITDDIVFRARQAHRAYWTF